MVKTNPNNQNSDNSATLRQLLESGGIDVLPSTLFDSPPSPLSSPISFDRFKAMMLGLAIGDSLGNTSEGMLPGARRKKFGEVKDYLPARHSFSETLLGYPSDDTQLAFWTLEHLIDDGQLVMDSLAAHFARDRIFGIGGTVKRFLYNYHSGMPWQQWGVRSAGNGALMRIAPMIYPHLKSGSSDLWADTALAAMLTHNDRSSISACLSFVNILWQLLQMKNVPESTWWPAEYIKVASGLEGQVRLKPRCPELPSWRGPLWKFVEEHVLSSWEDDLPTLKAFDKWYSGAYLLETVPCALYILMRHGHDFEEAVIRAANDTKDNDTIAAIVGAAMGALHGLEAIPERWIRNLSGRTSFRDDDQIFFLLEKARQFYHECAFPEDIPTNQDLNQPVELALFRVKNSAFVGMATMTINETLQTVNMKLPSGESINENYDIYFFFNAFKIMCEQLTKKQGLALRVCGQCRYFGFSGMTAQFSAGRAGYCKVKLFPSGSPFHKGPTQITDYCYRFSYRPEQTSSSPFLPA